VMASDGIFDCLKNQHVSSYARRTLRQTQSPEAAAANVIQASGETPKGKSDNSSVMVVVFNMPAPLPKRAPVRQAALPNLNGR
jgi:serine/threonine protein phosphatase PrpC